MDTYKDGLDGREIDGEFFAWWTSSMGSIEILIPWDAIGECAHSGGCDDDVEYWTPKIDFSGHTAQDRKNELHEYGAWDDEELADDDDNKLRIVWCACNDLAEERILNS